MTEAESGVQFSQQERRQLVEDIARIGLMLGREMQEAGHPYRAQERLPLSPRRFPEEVEDVSPFERLRLLEARWPQAQTALQAILQAPDSRLATRRTPQTLSRAQGGPDAADAIVRTPAGCAAWLRTQGQTAHPSCRKRDAAPETPVLLENRLERCAATAANRLVVTFLLEIEREARALALLARCCEETESAERAETLAQSALRWRTNSFLRRVAPLTPRQQAEAEQRAAARRWAPPYRALFSLWRTQRRALSFDWTESPLLRLPSLEAWHLYEIWCYLQVAVALRDLGGRLVEGDAVRCQAEGLRVRLTTGRASRLRFALDTAPPPDFASEQQASPRKQNQSMNVDLIYQPFFASANQDALRERERLAVSKDAPQIGFASLSHAMQPDIALYCQERLFLLDPKFRAYTLPGDEQDDINKMHAYRDAIVRRGSRETAAPPAVAAAWCLFPGEPAADSLPAASLPFALRAYPHPSPTQPFGNAGIGALRLRPGSPESQPLLRQLLAYWLRPEYPPVVPVPPTVTGSAAPHR